MAPKSGRVNSLINFTRNTYILELQTTSSNNILSFERMLVLPGLKSDWGVMWIRVLLPGTLASVIFTLTRLKWKSGVTKALTTYIYHSAHFNCSIKFVIVIICHSEMTFSILVGLVIDRIFLRLKNLQGIKRPQNFIQKFLRLWFDLSLLNNTKYKYIRLSFAFLTNMIRVKIWYINPDS